MLIQVFLCDFFPGLILLIQINYKKKTLFLICLVATNQKEGKNATPLKVWPSFSECSEANIIIDAQEYGFYDDVFPVHLLTNLDEQKKGSVDHQDLFSFKQPILN
jgi:hypothetical protein